MSFDSPRRLTAVDALRGLVIVLMALDHARDFFHDGAMTSSPTDMARTTPILFATRWVTHLCAPTFALLAGTGAWLRLQRPGMSRGALARYLATRGAWLILLELLVMRVAINFSLSLAYPSLLLVVWMLGLSMVVLAALVWVPPGVLLVTSILVIAGHNALDGVRAADLGRLGPLWRVLHEPGVLQVGRVVAVVGYPLLPWVAVMAAGFGMGPLFSRPSPSRRRALLVAGLASIVAFVVLRSINGYGDPSPWTVQRSTALTVASFLNTTKYPPSLAFLLMTLGPACLLLAWFDRCGLRPRHPLAVLGRVPLMFYVTHFWALHAMAALTALAVYGVAALGFLWMPVPSMGGPAASFPQGFGYPLSATYVAWAVVLVLLWPLCRWADHRRGRGRADASVTLNR